MAVWSTTFANTKNRIRRLVFRLGGQVQVTHEDMLIITEAINSCIVDLSTERSLGLKVIESDTTVTTTVGTNYVDLSSNVIAVVDDEVRIPAENVILGRISMSDFTAIDAGDDLRGMVYAYAIDVSSDANVIRLRLRNIPDAAYVISLKVRTLPDADLFTGLPVWMGPLVSAGSKARALEDLGFYKQSQFHEARYQERLKNAIDAQKGHTGPEYVKMQRKTTVGRSIQERANL